MRRGLFVASSALLFCLSSTYLFSQDIKIPESRKQLKDSTFSNYLKKIESRDDDSKLVFSGSMLNSLFRGELSSFFTSANDFTLDNYFLSTDTDAKTLTIGMSKDLDVLFGRVPEETKKLYRLNHIGTFYTKSSVDKNFSSLTKRNSETEKVELNSGIGFGVKYTFLGRGSISFSKKSGAKFEELRKKVINKKIGKEIESYNQSELIDELTDKIIDKKLSHLSKNDIEYYDPKFDIDKYQFPDGVVDSVSLEKEIVKKKYYKFLERIIEKEVELLTESKLYTAFRTHWISLESFYPITGQAINVSPDESTNFSTKDFRNWRHSAALNFLRTSSSKNIFVFSIVGSVFNNNNFLSQNTSAKSFQNISNTTTDFQVLGTSNKVFVGNYDEFATFSIKGESGILIANTVGLSGAIERNFDKFNVTNWKLAIPFSLIDKDGKPTVNFEFQWKETYGEHSLGIGIGYMFGRYIK